MMALAFDAIAAKVRTWYVEERLSHQAIAERLRAEDIAPALGHPCWDWRTVDAVLVLECSKRHSIEAHTAKERLCPELAN